MTFRASMLRNTLLSFYLHLSQLGLLKCLNVAWRYPFYLKNEFQNFLIDTASVQFYR